MSDDKKDKKKPKLSTKEWGTEAKSGSSYLDPNFGKKGTDRSYNIFGKDRNVQLLNGTLVLLVLLLCGIILFENKDRLFAGDQDQYRELNLSRPDRSGEITLLERSLEDIDKVIESTISDTNSYVSYDGQRVKIKKVVATFNELSYGLNMSLVGDKSLEVARIELDLVETATHAYAPEVRACSFYFKFGKYQDDAFPCNISSEESGVLLKDFYLNGPLKTGGNLEYLLSASLVIGSKETSWYVAGDTPLKLANDSDLAQFDYLTPEAISGSYVIAGERYEILDVVAIVRPRLDRVDLTFFSQKLDLGEKRDIIKRESATIREREEVKPVANVVLSFTKDKKVVSKVDIGRLEAELMNPLKDYRESIEQRVSQVSSIGVQEFSARLIDKEPVTGALVVSEGDATLRVSFTLSLIEIY